MIQGHQLYLVAAIDEQRGIGTDEGLPWQLPGELRFFAELTMNTEDASKQNIVIMGRKTWESIPERHRPLPNRVNVVLSRQSDYQADGAQVLHSLHALEETLAQVGDAIESIYIIGGGDIFEQVISDERVDGIYLTHIKATYPEMTAHFPEMPADFVKKQKVLEASEIDRRLDDDAEVAYETWFYGKVQA